MDTSQFYGGRSRHHDMLEEDLMPVPDDPDDVVVINFDSDDENDPAFSLVELEEEELPPDVTEQEDAAPLRAGGVRRQDAAPWRIVGDDASPKDHPEWLGSIPLAEELRQPVEYFRDFFDDEFLKFIVTQSNLYATQQNVNKPLKLDKDELEQFLGTVFLMSLFKISNTRLYWSGVLEFDSVSKVFSRRRWEEIKSSLHFNDNTQAPDRTGPNADRLFKVRPLLDHLQSKFRSIPMQQMCCIDEMIVPFKGNSYLKQYIPSKPHKWGFKVFALCDTSGILNDFHVYDGPLKPVQGEPDLGPSSNIVLQLARTIPVNANHLLYHDNWFTSPKLMAHLATKQIYSLVWRISKARVAIYQNMRLDELYLVVYGNPGLEVPVKREEALNFTGPQTLSLVPVVDREGVGARTECSRSGPVAKLRPPCTLL
ncbi:piggyBac transposable element-derived protein 3-like [Scylla paramamosain]|uniref:piggyBac transposable element-derived protein 3-like n=1 Tax=Scylla paramamosain TaxID=85552 RepID=UPI0030829086